MGDVEIRAATPAHKSEIQDHIMRQILCGGLRPADVICEGWTDDARRAMRCHAQIASDTLLDVLTGVTSWLLEAVLGE